MPTTGVWVGVEPVGVAEAQSVFSGLELRIAQWRAAIPELYVIFRRIEQRRFQDGGPGWEELAPATVQERRYEGLGPEPILSRSGANMRYGERKGGQLRRSLTTARAKGARLRVGPDNVFMGTADPVAAYHQYGTKTMPARVLVDATEADAEMYAETISKFLMGFYATDVVHTGIGVDEGL
jgi:hypothetical protein